MHEGSTTQQPDSREQCGAHAGLMASVGQLRERFDRLQEQFDRRTDHITERVDSIYDMLATARNGGGNGSANTLTVTATGGQQPAQAPAPKTDDSVPWPRLIALLGLIAVLLCMVVVGGLSGALKLGPEHRTQIEAPSVPPR